MLPKKGKGQVKRSHPDAKEVAAGRQVNVHVDIHPGPPEEDMPTETMQPPAEAVQPPAVAMPPPESCDWSCNQSWQSVIGRATSCGNLQLVMQPVVAICDWSYNQSQQSVNGRATTNELLWLIYGIAPPIVQPVVKATVVCDRNGRS